MGTHTQNISEDSEDIEGLDHTESAGWDEYPLDSVFVRTETRTVSEVLKRIDAGRYDLNPEFQRDFVWPLDKQSRLIESCLMRIPLPVFYVAEAKDGRIIVVDGLQRLTTFYRFLRNEFALAGLGNTEDETKQEHPLTGTRFNDLPVNLQERVEDTQLTLYILDAKAPERAKLDIFERVNGGVPLTRQQMRNCLYSGEATRWLKNAADSELFQNVTGKSLARDTMRDREAINRFCAFYLLGEQNYKGMDNFLAEALEKMNALTESELTKLMNDFEHSLRTNETLFGKHAFRKSLIGSEYSSRSVINIALFDVCSVLLAQEDISSHEDQVRQVIQDLIKNNEEFKHAISYSTNSTKQVQSRFRLARSVLAEVLT